MPDAHVGYGLPIGGVLATKDAVIPYAVGVDIACRMKLTVLDLPVRTLATGQDRLARAIERETRFGIGASFQTRRQHEVMDADWHVTAVTARHEGPRLGAARHERQRQSLRRVRRAHGARPRGRTRGREHTSRSSATRAAAARARRSPTTTASWRAPSTRSCPRRSHIWPGSTSPPTLARSTGRRWS